MSGRAEVDWINNFVISVLLITIEILGSTTVTYKISEAYSKVDNN
jgi:hypothetical protein